MSPKYPVLFLFLSTIGIGTAFAVSNGSVNYGGRRAVPLAQSFQQPMQRVLDRLRARGYQPRDVGCFGYRPNNRSAHPTGHACDVDQTDRNVTRVNKFISKKEQIQIAQSEGAVSGCKWRNPDCGHFEARSAPYSPAGTRIGSHRFSGFEDRPVSRRTSGTSRKRRGSRPAPEAPWNPWGNSGA